MTHHLDILMFENILGLNRLMFKKHFLSTVLKTFVLLNTVISEFG